MKIFIFKDGGLGGEFLVACIMLLVLVIGMTFERPLEALWSFWLPVLDIAAVIGVPLLMLTHCVKDGRKGGCLPGLLGVVITVILWAFVSTGELSRDRHFSVEGITRRSHDGMTVLAIGMVASYIVFLLFRRKKGE